MPKILNNCCNFGLNYGGIRENKYFVRGLYEHRLGVDRKIID